MTIMEKFEESKKYILTKTNDRTIPKIALTLGSGLGIFCERLKNKIEIPYKSIPHFHNTSVPGHSGQLVLGEIDNQNILVLQGRIHAYEGHSLEAVTFPTRLVKYLGCQDLILTNASGGISKNFKAGDLVMIKDHINLTGKNPLVGKNIDSLGLLVNDLYELSLSDMGFTYGIEIIPHTWGTGIAFHTALHFIANLEPIPGRLFPADCYIEYDRTENGIREQLTTPSIQLKDGYIEVPQRPSLGIEVNEDALQFYVQNNKNGIKIS